MKLEINKDYINEIGYTVHITNYYSGGLYYTDDNGNRYLSNGKVLKGVYSLVGEVVTIASEPTKDEVKQAFTNMLNNPDTPANKEEFKGSMLFATWVEAIEWYKQFKIERS